jgi:hypothetical protein
LLAAVVVVQVNQAQRAVAVAAALARPSWAKFISQQTPRSLLALVVLVTAQAEQAFKAPIRALAMTL